VNRQSNLKLTYFKQLKIAGSDMSGLRSDMFGLGRICLVWSQICPVTKNFEQQKSRSGAKTMHLRPDKLTINKLDNIELRELTGTTRSNPERQPKPCRPAQYDGTGQCLSGRSILSPISHSS
jgi:hypothetical protein